MHQQHHLEYPLLACDKSHDHRQRQIERLVLGQYLNTPRLFNLQFTEIVSHGLRIYDAHTNLPARGPTSTNLLARSPALRISLLVVLLYGPTRP
ncbi:hypothetical protein DEO72_LG7g738 [Vigna unguiculata]|uniref:Uncharacterized protein n=1 Tax=Vigna unguiculata TaxID=3917 RepID=A0A4D6MEN1_VIGUN|nr:hypothetical protein DEO72_LG7g738 [Vigna unguiculata]